MVVGLRTWATSMLGLLSNGVVSSRGEAASKVRLESGDSAVSSLVPSLQCPYPTIFSFHNYIQPSFWSVSIDILATCVSISVHQPRITSFNLQHTLIEELVSEPHHRPNTRIVFRLCHEIPSPILVFLIQVVNGYNSAVKRNAGSPFWKPCMRPLTSVPVSMKPKGAPNPTSERTSEARNLIPRLSRPLFSTGEIGSVNLPRPRCETKYWHQLMAPFSYLSRKYTVCLYVSHEDFNQSL